MKIPRTEIQFYRYEAREYSAGTDEFGDPIHKIVPDPKVSLMTFNLHKETPKGYWIGHGFHCPDNLRANARWVSKTGRKRYAYPTKEEALESFIKRKEKQVKILKHQTWSAEIALKLAQELKIKHEKFKPRDKVNLPFNEEGEVVEYLDLLWGSRYNVRITKSNGFNDVGEVVDFFEKDLELINN
jgi:hypothetical protein